MLVNWLQRSDNAYMHESLQHLQSYVQSKCHLIEGRNAHHIATRCQWQHCVRTAESLHCLGLNPNRSLTQNLKPNLKTPHYRQKPFLSTKRRKAC